MKCDMATCSNEATVHTAYGRHFCESHSPIKPVPTHKDNLRAIHEHATTCFYCKLELAGTETITLSFGKAHTECHDKALEEKSDQEDGQFIRRMQ